MAYPSIYAVTYSYTAFQQSQGDNSFPGTQLDADLAGLQASIQNLEAFTGLVVRSDGALNNGIVTYDSLSPKLQTAGLAPASTWATLTNYAKDANVVFNFGLYRAAVAHFSGVFATDLAAARWTLVTTLPSVSYLPGTGLQLNTLTFSIDATVATLNGAQVLTNKSINAANNPITNLTTAMFAANVVDTDGTLAANSDTRIPSQKALKTYADQIIASADAMVFKGVIDCSANPNYPAADRGWTYKVSVAGLIGGGSGVAVEVGDTLMCITDGTASGTQAAVGAAWNIVQVNINGAVVGPASSVDQTPAVFSGTTGKLIANMTFAAFGAIAALITGQTAAAAVSDTDTFATNQGATNLKQTFAAIKTWLKTFLATNAALLASPTTPTGTSSATGVMMGLGVTTCRFTPVNSTRALITLTGAVGNSTVGGSSTLTFRYGTGAGPANGVALTGTGVGSSIAITSPTANSVSMFSLGGLVTGLTPGVTYWFDMTLGASAGTSAASSITATAIELS